MGKPEILIEMEYEGEGRGITLSPSSVDTQIDSLLVSFENESLEADDEVVPEGVSITKNLDLLLEQPEDEEEDPGGEVAEEEPAVTDDELKTDEPADPLTPKVNIDEFTERVAMLLETYTKRLDVETVIFNRAKNYLTEEHGEEVARQFEDILVTEHDIDLRDQEHEDPQPNPQAVGAMGPSV